MLDEVCLLRLSLYIFLVSVRGVTERVTASQGIEKSVDVFIEHRNRWGPLYGVCRSRTHGPSKMSGFVSSQRRRLATVSRKRKTPGISEYVFHGAVINIGTHVSFLFIPRAECVKK